MKLLFRNRIATWLTATLAVLVLAACGQTTTVDTHDITVSVTGAGTVSALDGDIECTSADEATCSATVEDGTEVTLTATPDNVDETVTWGGACAGATGDSCTVTVTEDTNISATFEAAAPAEPELTVNVNGDGTVTSDVGGITCTTAGEDTCTATFDSGDEITLTATETGADPFVMWSGDVCDGDTAAECTFTINADTSVSATFGDFSTEYRRTYSYGTDPASAATLSIDYTGDATADATAAIANDAHDAEELISASLDNPTAFPAGFTYNDSSDLELGYDPTHGPQHVGLLFQDVDVPADAAVNSATLTLTGYENASAGTTGDVELTVTAEASTNPAAFANDADEAPSSDISGRTTLVESASWTVSGTLTEGGDLVLDNAEFAALVEAIVAQEGWSQADNGMAFIISPATP